MVFFTLSSHINPTEEWRTQPNFSGTEQAPEQAPDKLPDKLPDKFGTDNVYIRKLVEVVGCNEVALKDMLKMLGFKDRESFMNVYLNPALKEQFVCMKYPDKPRHPRQ